MRLWCLIVLLVGYMLALPGVSASDRKKKRYEDFTVHLVFSNHLDVGFTDLDNNVVSQYFHEHYPAAIHLDKKLKASHKNHDNDRFRYLTHSWLLSLFFDCPPAMGFSCPNTSEVAAVRQAIADGVITWHASPFNPQYEMFDAGLLGFAINLTHSLDDAFGLPHKQMLSLRDVPGLTRGAIPVLSSSGVRAITGGVNGFSAPPGVPKTTPFIWRDEESGQQLLAMWHPGGYAGSVKGIHIDSRHDCITAAGFHHVLCASWRDDNRGPPDSLDELLAMFHITRKQWPGAKVIASTLDDYLTHLVEAVEQQGLQLPVVTGELGDTWIHGVGSDPLRMADYRAVLRARTACCSSPDCDSTSAAFFNFSRILVKVAEHTWGISFNQYFGDFSNFTNAWLHRLLQEGEGKHPGLALSLESWRRQRKYIDWALQALPAEHPILAAVAADRQARQQHHGMTLATLAASGARQVYADLAETGDGDDVDDGVVDDDSASFLLLENLQHLQHQQNSGDMEHADDAEPEQTAADSATSLPGPGPAPAPAVATGGAGGGDAHQPGLMRAAAGPQLSPPYCEGVQRSPGALLFCSKSWMIQVDPETGGLLQLRHLYGGPDGQQRLGNDWAAAAAAAPSPSTSSADVAAGTDSSSSSSSHGSSSSWSSLAGWLQQLSSYCSSLASATAAAIGSSSSRGPATPGPRSSRSLLHKMLMRIQSQQLGEQTKPAVQQDEADASRVLRLEQQQQQQQSGKSRHQCMDLHQQQHIPRHGFTDSSPAFAQLQYNVYNLRDYDFVWDNYAYLHPVWVGDFGKWNMSYSSNLSAVAQPKLRQLFQTYDSEHGLMLHLKLAWPKLLVRQAGAPAASWLVLHSPGDSTALHVTVVWQDKTPTRLPEAMWLRFRPGSGAVDESSWVMHKLDSQVRPSEILLNGSHSLHAVSHRGVSVKSAAGDEQLQISSLDVPLVNVGKPVPFPNPCLGPDMSHGVSFNIINNIWGTNYAMWFPFNPEDGSHMSFRFTLDATQVEPDTATAATF